MKAMFKLIIPVTAFFFFMFNTSECIAEINPEIYQLLTKHVFSYSKLPADQRKVPDSYGGEEGVLLIRPDAAENLGFSVYIDQDYRDAVDLVKESDDALNLALKALSRKDKKGSGEFIVQEILSYVLEHKEKGSLAAEKMSRYKANIKKEADERYSRKACSKIISALLEESLTKTDNNIRDALGLLYNRIQGEDSGTSYVTADNVKFVNHVFNGFMAEASPSDITVFNTDKNVRNGSETTSDEWKKIVKEDLPEFLPFIESAVNKTGKSIYRTDPLLFISLMRRESAFDPEAVSSVGAAGLTQIMPYTAKDLGLKNIYMTDYYKKAGEYLRKEQRLGSRAKKMLLKIETSGDIQIAERARELMLQSFKAGDERKKLYKKYKEELLKNKKDERLNPAKAIESGYIYFSRLMKSQDGDISLALASYNAGPGRVRQYKGIPPYEETVKFRNRVLQFYKDYLDRLKK